MYFEIRFIVIYFSPFFLLHKNINEEEPLCLNLLPFLSKIIICFFLYVSKERIIVQMVLILHLEDYNLIEESATGAGELVSLELMFLCRYLEDEEKGQRKNNTEECMIGTIYK